MFLCGRFSPRRIKSKVRTIGPLVSEGLEKLQNYQEVIAKARAKIAIQLGELESLVKGEKIPITREDTVKNSGNAHDLKALTLLRFCKPYTSGL
jgi:hypothetical protein